MGLVWRGGRPYYYRSVRAAAGVRSEYVGAGDIALIRAALDAEDRENTEERRRLEEDERRQFGDLERALAATATAARAAAFEALGAAGYRRHKRGEWRKRRGHRAGQAG